MAQKNPPEVDLGDVIFAIAPDVGQHWKSLIDLLGMEARKDVQKIQHECTKTQDGSSSLAQRCTEHMFALWRSRLVQSGVSDHEAMDTLINALQMIPQLKHVANKCMDMLGRKADTSQTEVERQTFERSDSGVYSTASGMVTEPTKAPITNSVQEGAPTLQQHQRPSTPATSASAGTTTATSVTQRNKSPTPSPSGDSSNVLPKQPVNTSQYQNPGMLNVNSPVPQASVASSGGTHLPTPQQDLGGSPVVSMHSASQPHDSYSLSQSSVSQLGTPPPSEQPPFSSAQPDSVLVPAAATALESWLGQDQQLHDGSPKSELLTLSVDRALLIWYKITSRDIFRCIEWNCLSAELLNSHHCLFATNESEQLAAGMPSCKQAVDSAVRKTPQSVLHAIYKSLLDTRTCGGAIYHVSVAGEIQKEVMQQTQPTTHMSATHTPANEQSWPSRSQLAAAVPDKGLHVGKDATIKSPHLQKGEAPQLDLAEDKKLSRLESSRVESNQQKILGLAHSLASSIWFKILCNDNFHGIEWESLSKELVNTHHDWFNIDEIAKLCDRKPYSKDALSSAVTRNAPEVLHAFYQSLCATQSCGGAAQHASIAADIQKETLMAAVTKSYSYPPASDQLQSFSSWPTSAQLASAEPDFGMEEWEALMPSVTKSYSYPPASNQLHQSYSSWATNAQLASAVPDFMRQASATAQLVHWKTTDTQRCRSGTPAVKEQEEWEGVVAFICHHFGGNAPRDVVSALHRVVVPRHQSYSFPPSSQELSEAIQQVVKERCMTWVQFARFLLLSRTTRPFVFKIVQYIGVGIRFVFKQELSKNLGSDWYRLACAMGLPKTDVDNIEDRKDITLLGKIDAFLMTYHFPAFRSDEETTEFLVEALERACLFSTAAAVRRDLKHALQREASKRYEKNERQNLELYAEDADQQDEVCLQKLCYMPTGIKKFLISPIGGTITLGNDASLMVCPGTVTEETLVHYAILLHGSIIFPPGYELASVIVYLNMDGVMLMKPISLFLSHWCIKKDGDGEDTLKFFRASHTLDVEQQKYVFEEQKKEDSDFTTHINAGVLTIWRSQCLYCVARNRTTTARYSAITFSQYIQSEETLYFRIQFTCDSLTWNKEVTHLLQRKNWKKAGINDAVAQFQFTDSQQAITARPGRRMGPGWEAAIEGHQAIVEDNFRPPEGKSASEIEEEITSGHFPPCIYYTILYTSPENLRVKPGMMIVDVDGANVPLSFSCRVQEENSPTLRMSPTSCGAVSATPSLPYMGTVTIDAEDILDFFRVDFIKLTDANTILYELRHKKIISDGDLTEITRNSDAQQQNEILHRCLKRSCDEEALMEVCGMMIDVDGNRKMNALGQKMKCKLEGN